MSSRPDQRTALPSGGWPHSATIAPNQEPIPDSAPVDDDLFAQDWDKPRRTNRLTAVLVALIVATLAFAGGVAVQKAHDKGLVAGTSATRVRGPGGPGGTGGAAGSGRTGGGGATAAPVAVGTVKSISGTELTLTVAGKVVTVTVPPTATVTSEGLGGLVTGMTVSVAGTTAADGSVTATSVTSRGTGG